MGWYLADVEAARMKIAAACPDVHFEKLDYGFALYGYKLGPNGGIAQHTYRTIMRPGRPPDPDSGFDGQDEIVNDIDDLIKFWRTA